MGTFVKKQPFRQKRWLYAFNIAHAHLHYLKAGAVTGTSAHAATCPGHAIMGMQRLVLCWLMAGYT